MDSSLNRKLLGEEVSEEEGELVYHWPRSKVYVWLDVPATSTKGL
jgi:hypothetical protein